LDNKKGIKMFEERWVKWMWIIIGTIAILKLCGFF
jgi:hypothetical protein